MSPIKKLLLGRMGDPKVAEEENQQKEEAEKTEEKAAETEVKPFTEDPIEAPPRGEDEQKAKEEEETHTSMNEDEEVSSDSFTEKRPKRMRKTVAHFSPHDEEEKDFRSEPEEISPRRQTRKRKANASPEKEESKEIQQQEEEESPPSTPSPRRQSRTRKPAAKNSNIEDEEESGHQDLNEEVAPRRQTRNRRSVTHYSPETVAAASMGLGRGLELNQIAATRESILLNADDEVTITLLHKFLFRTKYRGRPNFKHADCVKEILSFSGYLPVIDPDLTKDEQDEIDRNIEVRGV